MGLPEVLFLSAARLVIVKRSFTCSYFFYFFITKGFKVAQTNAFWHLLYFGCFQWQSLAEKGLSQRVPWVAFRWRRAPIMAATLLNYKAWLWPSLCLSITWLRKSRSSQKIGTSFRSVRLICNSWRPIIKKRAWPYYVTDCVSVSWREERWTQMNQQQQSIKQVCFAPQDSCRWKWDRTWFKIERMKRFYWLLAEIIS